MAFGDNGKRKKTMFEKFNLAYRTYHVSSKYFGYFCNCNWCPQ